MVRLQGMRIAQRKNKRAAGKEAENAVVANDKLSEQVPDANLGLLEQPVRFPLREAAIAIGMMYVPACADSTKVPELALKLGQQLVCPAIWARNVVYLFFSVFLMARPGLSDCFL
jgi:hypothetical protein